MVGRTISHYKILDKIGEGGMGVVYRAEDTKLRRPVALKILRPEASEDTDLKARLSKEAEIAASLDHPNITTVYEIDEADGRTFLAMPLVEGETLSAKIRQRPLPLPEALDFATQIAEALHAAHGKGVVHRDIKPGNIMITPEGRVKVMDFGLAHLAGQTHITKTGTVLGTPAYMSPEQARGEEADPRSDIWSLGVVIYEMVAGRQPFPGENSQSVMYSIVHDEHEPITALRVGVPPELDRIVGKALSKRPEERYQHANEMTVDLRAMGKGTAKVGRQAVVMRLSRRSLVYGAVGVAVVILAVVLGMNADRLRERFFSGGATKIDSIAILPLQNLSGDPEKQYFSDGMTEALYTDLAKISALKVISPRSTKKYQGTGTTIRQIARELGADAIVQGSAMRAGEQVRITAQLIDAETDENLWADSYARDFRDVLALQSEVARAISRRIQVELTPDEAVLLSGARQVDPAAYEAYLKGHFENAKLTGAGLDAALEHFESALKHDPGFAAAYAAIANVWAARQQLYRVLPAEAAPKIRAALFKALELDNTLVEVHHALAVLRTWTDWDWEAAEASFRRAIEISPNYPDARATYSHFLLITGRSVQAIAQMERALELDPSNIHFHAFFGEILTKVRRYDEAIPHYRKVLEITPNSGIALQGMARAYHNMGMQDEAIQMMMEIVAVRRNNPEWAEHLGHIYAEAGYQAAWKAAADHLLTRFSTTVPKPKHLAELYMRAGEKELALEWLEKAFEMRTPSLPYITVIPEWDSLRNDPRFQGILRRMNLLQYQAVPSGM